MAVDQRAAARASTDVERWRSDVVARVRAGDRFAGLYGVTDGDSCRLTALLVTADDVDACHAVVQPDARGVLAYPALSTDVPAAFWYERALHDLSGVLPLGHPRLDPLLLCVAEETERPRPGAAATDVHRAAATELPGPVDVAGDGLLTLPLGPVRSGVMETVEFLIETPGEDIPHLNIRPHHKHRGVAKAFEGRSLDDGVLVAERVEGISSVAHALAYCHAVERLDDVTVPARAALVRVVHAELERIANHLDVTMRLADAAGLAVATARFGWHKEIVMRLVSDLCGSRFGRGVVVPGGVSRAPALDPVEAIPRVESLRDAVAGDATALQDSASFLDRLRGTGPLAADLARRHGALGPVGRGSGYDDDHRRSRARTYDAYRELPARSAPTATAGDALARARVRWSEIDASARLVADALTALTRRGPGPLRAAVHGRDGFTVGWSESAQGEVLYAVDVAGDRIRRCLARSASFHNLVLFHDVFVGDIFTDFPFIEASFGLSYAGVAM